MTAEGVGAAGRDGGSPAELFCYDPEELVLRGVEWPRSGAGAPRSPAWSRFDRMLREGWDDRLRRGLFRYRLGELQTRVLPGRLGLVAQLNVQRATERRRPQEARSVRQRFDPRQFNFGQIRREEVLFCLCRGCPALTSSPRALVAINVSPLEQGHVLLIPDPALALPQILTPEALLVGLDAVLLSTHPGFRLGFNSLGAFASVNHLHLHCFYLDWELSVESAPCEALLPEAGLYLLREAPAPAFLFYCDDGRQLEPLAHRICRVTCHLSQREIAHNLFATRGAAPEGPLGSRARPGVRVILWVRKACFGTKEEFAFNVAVCELAGHLPTKTVQEYEGLTEASVLHRIQQYLLPDRQLAQLQDELVDLLRGPCLPDMRAGTRRQGPTPARMPSFSLPHGAPSPSSGVGLLQKKPA